MALKGTPMKRAKVSRTSSTVKKRPAKACGKKRRFTLKKCRSIITKLKCMSEIPEGVQARLKQLTKGKRKAKPDGEALAQVLQEALSSVEKSLLGELRAAYAAVDGAGKEKEAREAAQAAAEARVAELAQAVTDEKAVLRSAAKAIEQRTEDIAEAKAAIKKASAELNTAQTKKRKFETVEKDTFQPLRDTTPSGASGHKRVKSLCKAGKANGFHGELLLVLPSILKKQPDKRRTFDNLTLEQLDVEFCKRTNSLEDEIKGAEQSLAEKSSAFEEAQAALQSTKEEERRESRELAGAGKALVAGKEAVVQARRHVRSFPMAVRQAARALAKAKALVGKFRSGPLAKFQEMVPDCTGPEEDAADSVVHDSDSASD